MQDKSSRVACLSKITFFFITVTFLSLFQIDSCNKNWFYVSRIQQALWGLTGIKSVKPNTGNGFADCIE